MSEEKPNIDVPQDGPFLVKGLKKLTDSDNQPVAMQKDVIALCRCGASENKPFCDGTHKDIGFTSKKERTQTIILQSVRLGDIGIAASEAETFIEIGQAIQEHSPFEHTIALGYTNGCIGYLPTAVAYSEGGYEVDSAIRYYGLLMMSPESERIVVDRSTRLLEQVRS